MKRFFPMIMILSVSAVVFAATAQEAEDARVSAYNSKSTAQTNKGEADTAQSDASSLKTSAWALYENYDCESNMQEVLDLLEEADGHFDDGDDKYDYALDNRYEQGQTSYGDGYVDQHTNNDYASAVTNYTTARTFYNGAAAAWTEASDFYDSAETAYQEALDIMNAECPSEE